MDTLELPVLRWQAATEAYLIGVGWEQGKFSPGCFLHPDVFLSTTVSPDVEAFSVPVLQNGFRIHTSVKGSSLFTSARENREE